MKKDEKRKLKLWQDRLAANLTAYQDALDQMDGRERIYDGDHRIKVTDKKDSATSTPYVRNLGYELIESTISSNIPSPKVTARHKEDEHLAKIIEDMLRNELDRLPAETNNDMMERTVPIQGGGGFHVEWDNSKRTHTTVGELTVTVRHPKQIIPQDGVTSVEDMDYIFLRIPQTKGYIRRAYGVDLENEKEEAPEIRSADTENSAEDMVTQNIAYYRNNAGGIGLYTWVGDTVLADLDDYQARRLRRCKICGAPEPGIADPMELQTMDGTYPGQLMESSIEMPEKPEQLGKRKVCPYCNGTKWEHVQEEYEEIYTPIAVSWGTIPGETPQPDGVDPNGSPVMVLKPTRIPYYKPDIYPIILQKNVSQYGKFLGGSDIDRIADQQNTTNRISAKVDRKLMDAGSILVRPNDCTATTGPGELREYIIDKPSQMGMFDVKTLQGDVSQDMAYRTQVYEEARQVLGITDSFQGRKDPTATSGKAKEFSAAQSAGRLESKRIMKNAAYADLFEAMFKFKLAYTDEPRPVVSRDTQGNTAYGEFNRYEFLKKDAAGDYYWNTDFLFSVDTSAPLAGNREAMWQETRMNFQSGCYGNPQKLTTMILFWTRMAQLHYPTARDTADYLREELKKEQQAQQDLAQMQQTINEKMNAMNQHEPGLSGSLE